MKHKITPAKFSYRVLAFPDLAGEPFPIRVLAHYGLDRIGRPNDLLLTPNSAADSGRIQLNPIFGDCGPLWLRCYSAVPRLEYFNVANWHFVPWHDDHADLNATVEQARFCIRLHHGEKGDKLSPPLRYAHYARITTKHTFPLDMLRYDRCAPATQDDADAILKIETTRRGGVVNVVQLSDSVRPHWWPDRWHSWSGVEFEIAKSLDGLCLDGNAAYPLDYFVGQ